MKWIYVESGNKIKKVTFKLISNGSEYKSFTDHNYAAMEEFDMKRKGQKFENSVNDFLDDCKRVIEAELEGRKEEFKVSRMSVSDYNKALKKGEL